MDTQKWMNPSLGCLMGCFLSGCFAPGYNRYQQTTDVFWFFNPMAANSHRRRCGSLLTLLVLLGGISVFSGMGCAGKEAIRVGFAAGAVNGYEAATVLAIALKKTGGKAHGLTQALKGIKNFKGLTDTFDMNRYGDAIRPFNLATIRDGIYVDIEAIVPAQSLD